MVTDTAPEFDLGPLSWVQGEIDHALSRGVEALTAFKASPRDATALKHARAHIHQAAGAIQMVGLDAVTAYTDELERQLTRIEELPPPEVEAACDLVDRACRKLKIFLDELVGGANPVPLKLFPEYELMQQARGVRAAAPTDLFYPDRSPRGALLRRDQRSSRSAGAGGTACVPAAWPDSECRRTVRRCRARAAASARGARPSGHHEGSVAQTDRRARRELAQAQAGALRAARQDRGDRRAFTVEALRCARGPAGQAAQRTGFRSARHGIRDRTAARRIRDRELCDDLAGAASAGRRDDRASRYEPARRRRRGAVARRGGAPCAGAFAARPGCARNSGEPAAYGAGARRILQGPRQACRPGHTRPRQQ